MAIGRWTSAITGAFAVSALHLSGIVPAAHAVSLVNSITLPGNATDLNPVGNNPASANLNRLGGFGSDLFYDRTNNVYYGLVDRGPGGGTLPYDTRVQKFSLDVNPQSGAISNFKLLDTILFTTRTGDNLNGLNPLLLNGDRSKLGLSFDPEGFVVASNGNFYVSDEYGPSVYEFKPNGEFVRAFQTPENLVAKESNGTLNYVHGRPTITSGRQDNRGFEGLTASPDGKKLYAVLQDPLVNEGDPDGRRGRNVRIVEFDTATGKSKAQYLYQLEALSDLNDRLPGTTDDFGANAQGRNIGLSAIVALNDQEFLVLERDNRGVGVEDPTGKTPVASKRVYKINLAGATDVSNVSLATTNALPTGVVPVTKSATPFLDIAAALKASGLPVPEKFEGLTIGPKLLDGSYAVLVATDNDFSVTQDAASSVQSDVCSNGTQVALDGTCPAGATLIPSFLYSFKFNSTELAGYVPAESVPEPTTMAGLAIAGLGGAWMKRRRSK